MNKLQKLSIAASSTVLALGISVGSTSAATISETINGTAYLSNGTTSITGTFLYDTVAGNAIDWSIKIPKNETDLSSSYILNPSNSVTYGDFGLTGDYEQVFDNPIVSLYFDTLTPLPTVPNTFVELDADRLCGISPCNQASDLNYPGQVLYPNAVVIISGRITATQVPVPEDIFGVVVAGGALMGRQIKKAKSMQHIA